MSLALVKIVGPSISCLFCRAKRFQLFAEASHCYFSGKRREGFFFSPRDSDKVQPVAGQYFLVSFFFGSVLVILIDCIVSCNKFISATPISST